MPWGLRRFQESRQLHFLTWSCYRRRQYLRLTAVKRAVEIALEQARRRYEFRVYGYVVMPEHVHLLVSEPAGGPPYASSRRVGLFFGSP